MWLILPKEEGYPVRVLLAVRSVTLLGGEVVPRSSRALGGHDGGGEGILKATGRCRDGGGRRRVMEVRLLGFGVIEVQGQRYDRDVVIDAGTVRRRDKKPSKALRNRYGHTPLSEAEDIPWGGERLVVGTGVDGALPVTPEVRHEAQRRGIELVAVPTELACRLLREAHPATVRAVLHVTC
jgi:hypothetical protein